MTIEEMKCRKQECGYSIRQLAELSGVPETTIQKVFSGKTASPRRETIVKLERVLERTAETEKPSADSYRTGMIYHAAGGSDMFRMSVREPGAVYAANYGAAAEDEKIRYRIPGKKQGEYTLEDYLKLPDELRVELIDGVFFEMEAPTTVHQAIGGYIHKILLDHVLAHGGQCMPFVSPVDVQLDEDDRTVVQPDVLIVCDRKKFRKGKVFGAPDFIAEVLSQSTRKKDMRLKLAKYAAAGVREYWMIDPEKKALVVYDLEHDAFPALYGFEDTVPVMIWNGECCVDLKEMYGLISFLYN